MNAVKDDIPKLVDKELTAANKVYPLFVDRIHTHGVILEELEETRECLENLEAGLETIWSQNRRNRPIDETIHLLEIMRATAGRMTEESVQVTAMCMKGIESLKRQIEEIEEVCG